MGCLIHRHVSVSTNKLLHLNQWMFYICANGKGIPKHTIAVQYLLMFFFWQIQYNACNLLDHLSSLPQSRVLLQTNICWFNFLLLWYFSVCITLWSFYQSSGYVAWLNLVYFLLLLLFLIDPFLQLLQYIFLKSFICVCILWKINIY